MHRLPPFFVWNPGLAQFLSLPLSFSSKAKSWAKSPELVNNLVQITFSIQSLRQSINMEDSLYLVDFFFPVCIFLWRKGHCASVTFCCYKRQLCVCRAPVAVTHNTNNYEGSVLRRSLHFLTHFFSISDQLERLWQHVEEIWCITHYAETNVALYLVLARGRPEAMGDYQKSSNMEMCMEGKGDWTAGEYSVLELHRESRDLSISARTVL